MDSTPIPVQLSESDPASVTALITTVAVVPVCEPAIQPSGAATNPPEKKVEETVPVPTGEELIGTAAAPNISSSTPPDINPMLTELHSRIVNVKRDREDASDDGVGSESKRRLLEDKNRLLTSVEDDPDEKTAAKEVGDLNWSWPSYDEVFDQSGNLWYTKRGKAPKLTTKGSPFQVIYRNARDVVLWPDTVQIKLKSPHLMAILSEYLPEDKDLQYLDKLDLDGRRVYDIKDKLKKHNFDEGDENSANISAGSQPSENGVHQDANLGTDISEHLHSKDVTTEGETHRVGSTMEEARLHLYHLVRFLDDEYKVVALRHKRMKEDKCVSFDMLWAFLAPGTRVVYRCSYTQEQLCAKVSANGYQQTQCGKIFSVTLAVWDYNGVAYRQCTIGRVIGAFGGETPFDTLGVRPIDMDRTTPAHVLEAEFTAKGRRFQELAMENSNCFMHYIGPTFRVKRNEIVKERADGRVMIDLRSFAVMNPNFPMRNAQPPVSPGSDEKEHMRYNNSVRVAQMEVHRNLMISRRGGRHYQNARKKLPACDSMEEPGPAFAGKPFIETENLIFAPAIVFGFSFTLKQWGAFAVTGFSEIEFDTNAFDALVMEPEHKGLLYSLVSQFIATPTTNTGPSTEDMPRVDPIANKGEGCIFLCYGPPGTGKTLTAESLAENLGRPLWALSVAELGTTPSDLERTLLRVLDIAAMWKAVLLLDEADVYLEKRVAAADLTRNAMTGVFMRLLEYYRGVLFLTTNRITTFDDAFRSRISLVLCYPKLNKGRRLQIWSAALARVQAGKGEEVKVSPDFLVEMARQKMNGREIRNAIHTAQTLARSKNEDLEEQHLRFVMRVITKTSDILDANLRDV